LQDAAADKESRLWLRLLPGKMLAADWQPMTGSSWVQQSINNSQVMLAGVLLATLLQHSLLVQQHTL
jgi:hypothetical protein